MKQNEQCKICGSQVSRIFNAEILGKHLVGYFRCQNCDFIQTEKPFWLAEAYSSAITDLDIGLISRNLMFADIISKVIFKNFAFKARFLDYAGGYGMFTRLMRDRGFDYYREDKFCINLFAENFDIIDTQIKNNFELVTAFEVFEHFDDPMSEIKKIFEYSDTIIFSTELHSDTAITDASQWWYFTPETGQHIAFYSAKSLAFIAEKLGCVFYTHEQCHMFTKRKFLANPLITESFDASDSAYKLIGLLQRDFELVRHISKVNSDKAESQKITYQDEQKQQRTSMHLPDLLHRLTSIEIELNDTKKKLKKEMSDSIAAQQQLAEVQLLLDENKLKLKTKNRALVVANKQNIKLKQKWVSVVHQLFIANQDLTRIQQTRLWRLAEVARKVSKKLFPESSLQRKFLKKTRSIFNKLSSSLKNEADATSDSRPVVQRQLNIHSKKIVYIGHSYHAKTKSTGFLLDYLKKHFEVTELLDETWRGQSFPDLSFVDDSYLAVIFFQNLPDPDYVAAVNNNNIVFFPMFDGHGYKPMEYWQKYSGLKVINFSKTLHEKLTGWNVNSIHFQYFPKPLSFVVNQEHKVFFWQRIAKIDIHVVDALLRKINTKMHIHQAIDPTFTFVKPTKSQEKRYSISYSSWFNNRKKMQQKVQECDIYIAPREYEGIGLSFLEAMSMGKAVVAANNPTMNEYISHNKTGYLFDQNDPKPIDFSSLSAVRSNTYAYMQEGWKNWENSKSKIIDFIKKP